MNIISLFGKKSFSEQFPERRIVFSDHAFLPCRCFDVILPVIEKRENTLNVFEFATLRLLQYQRYSLEELVEILCLQKDFCSLILLRLEELNYIDHQRILTSGGTNFLMRQEKQKEESKEKCVTLFMNKATGEMLSYVYEEVKKQPRFISLYDNRVSAAVGDSIGSEKNIKGYYLEKNSKVCAAPPTVMRVKQCLLDSVERSTELSPWEKYLQKSIISEYHFLVTESRPVLFHLQVAIQEGAVEDFLVSDGIYPSEPNLVKYVHEFQSFTEKVLRNANQSMSMETKEVAESVHLTKYPNVKIMGRYFELEDDATKDEKDEFYRNCIQSVQGIFSDVEWALHYYYQQNQLSSVMYRVVKQQTAQENQVSLLELLEKLCIPLKKEHTHLFAQLERGRLKRYEENQLPMLRILLPLIILQAKEDMNSKVYKLKREMPQFIMILHSLNDVASTVRHESDFKLMPEEYDTYFYQSKQIIEVLLGSLTETEGIQKTDSEIETKKSKVMNVSQMKINAILSLEQEIGHVLYRKLPDEVQQELQLISADKTAEQLPIENRYVLGLSRICEFYLKKQLGQSRDEKTVTKRQIIEELKSKGIQKIPKSIEKVGENYVVSALKGKGATLGAYTLVFLFLQTPEKANEFEAEGFLTMIDTISVLRGHGNQISIPPDLEKLSDLRCKVIKLLKWIGA